MSGLQPQSVVILADTREQIVLDLDPLPVVRTALATGDYVLAAAPQAAVIERKTGTDLLACIGRERGRFEAELARLRAFPARVVLVECSWSDLLRDHRSKLPRAAISGTISAWTARWCPFMFADTQYMAAEFGRRFFLNIAKQLWEQSEAFREKVER